ncbi:uncharacterized protein VTP21DRAFT_8940 [Calcarisporiella thermophila]|uniref:uncharacterized protein n=1 Tax=Calcarisporiella thermophila TaxID=911321 RepID=UPI0037438206
MDFNIKKGVIVGLIAPALDAAFSGIDFAMDCIILTKEEMGCTRKIPTAWEGDRCTAGVTPLASINVTDSDIETKMGNKLKVEGSKKTLELSEDDIKNGLNTTGEATYDFDADMNNSSKYSLTATWSQQLNNTVSEFRNFIEDCRKGPISLQTCTIGFYFAMKQRNRPVRTCELLQYTNETNVNKERAACGDNVTVQRYFDRCINGRCVSSDINVMNGRYDCKNGQGSECWRVLNERGLISGLSGLE